MKVITFLLLILLLALQSCGVLGSPETTANQFMNHLVQEEYEAAKELSTDNTHQLLHLLQAAQSLADEEQRAEKRKAVFECSCEQEAETAQCNCCENGDANECNTLTVVKVEGKWLVDMKKENGLH